MGLEPLMRPFYQADLKFFSRMKNCFNKIAKLLKQFKIANDFYNKWKILGDKTALFQGRVEAFPDYW